MCSHDIKSFKLILSSHGVPSHVYYDGTNYRLEGDSYAIKLNGECPKELLDNETFISTVNYYNYQRAKGVVPEKIFPWRDGEHEVLFGDKSMCLFLMYIVSALLKNARGF